MWVDQLQGSLCGRSVLPVSPLCSSKWPTQFQHTQDRTCGHWHWCSSPMAAENPIPVPGIEKVQQTPHLLHLHGSVSPTCIHSERNYSYIQVIVPMRPWAIIRNEMDNNFGTLLVKGEIRIWPLGGPKHGQKFVSWIGSVYDQSHFIADPIRFTHHSIVRILTLHDFPFPILLQFFQASLRWRGRCKL